jgi:hypothetical protein
VQTEHWEGKKKPYQNYLDLEYTKREIRYPLLDPNWGQNSNKNTKKKKQYIRCGTINHNQVSQSLLAVPTLFQ